LGQSYLCEQGHAKEAGQAKKRVEIRELKTERTDGTSHEMSCKPIKKEKLGSGCRLIWGAKVHRRCEEGGIPAAFWGGLQKTKVENEYLIQYYLKKAETTKKKKKNNYRGESVGCINKRQMKWENL